MPVLGQIVLQAVIAVAYAVTCVPLGAAETKPVADGNALLAPLATIDHRQALAELRRLRIAHAKPSAAQRYAIIERLIALSLCTSIERCAAFGTWQREARDLTAGLPAAAAGASGERRRMIDLWLAWFAGRSDEVASKLPSTGAGARGIGRALRTLALRDARWWKPGDEVSEWEEAALIFVAKSNADYGGFAQILQQAHSRPASFGAYEPRVLSQTKVGIELVAMLVDALEDAAVPPDRARPALARLASAFGVADDPKRKAALGDRIAGAMENKDRAGATRGLDEEQWLAVVSGLAVLASVPSPGDDPSAPATVADWLQGRILRHIRACSQVTGTIMLSDAPLLDRALAEAPDLWLVRAIGRDDEAARAAIREVCTTGRASPVDAMAAAEFRYEQTQKDRAREARRKTEPPSKYLAALLGAFADGKASPLGVATTVRDCEGLPVEPIASLLSKRVSDDATDVTALWMRDINCGERRLFTAPSDAVTTDWTDAILDHASGDFQGPQYAAEAEQWDGLLSSEGGDEEFAIAVKDQGWLSIDGYSLSGSSHQWGPGGLQTTVIHRQWTLTPGWHPISIQLAPWMTSPSIRLLHRNSPDQAWEPVPWVRLAHGDDHLAGLAARRFAFPTRNAWDVARVYRVGAVWQERAKSVPSVWYYPYLSAISLVADGKLAEAVPLQETLFAQHASAVLGVTNAAALAADPHVADDKVIASLKRAVAATSHDVWAGDETICEYNGSALYVRDVFRLGAELSHRGLQAQALALGTPGTRPVAAMFGSLALEINDRAAALKLLGHALDGVMTLDAHDDRRILEWFLLARAQGIADATAVVAKILNILNATAEGNAVWAWLNGGTRADCIAKLSGQPKSGIDGYWAGLIQFTTGSPVAAASSLRTFAAAHPDWDEAATAAAVAKWIDSQTPEALAKIPTGAPIDTDLPGAAQSNF